ncbi:MAG: sodium:proton antiporter, partial [Firmicutes bacterium HGW-Firmicutes-18]
MNDVIVKTITRIIIPFAQVYGIFIILHGHISPGGGFSGGAL